MSSKSSRTASPSASPSPTQWFGAMTLTLLGIVLASSCLQTWLSSRMLAANFVSPVTWLALIGVKVPAALPDDVPLGFAPVATSVGTLMLISWIVGSIWLVRQTKRSWTSAFACWGIAGSTWWCLLDLWEWAWIAAGILGWQSAATLLTVTPQFWLAFCLSGWMTTLAVVGAIRTETLAEPVPVDAPSSQVAIRWVGLACGLYVVVFTAMNWSLYFNLLIPHGDSAMYEEHLWNVLHGKGFRSYLDQGLFFGEHIQFVHLFLIPLYLIWPSHLLLELTESTVLALGAFPVFWMTRRQTGSDKMALAAGIAYLLYTPMQFLDIEIDLKTFRPEAFGIPLLLLTLDQLDRRHLRGLWLGVLFTVTVKEDYALIFGPLGLWIAAREVIPKWRTPTVVPRRPWVISGLVMSVGSVVYLWVATRVVMPWFRSGAEVHYARYFQKFGETPEQILRTMVTQPGLLFGELISTATILYALAMLVPVAFLPLFAPGRLAVGAPLFGILCLNELAKDPRHQFHAPLIAIVFWSAAGGLPAAIKFVRRLTSRFLRRPAGDQTIQIVPRTLLWTSALTTGFFFTLSPLGIPFWDTGSTGNWPTWNWQSLYRPNRRAELFAKVFPLIPKSARVASTDFVHPRFTHHERSYDYSEYLRKVSGYEQRVPEDTDFIVIDTQHPYSKMKRPEDVPEYRDHPDEWELLPDETEGYFIVLKRRPRRER